MSAGIASMGKKYILIHLGKTIKNKRLELGYSLEEVAQYLGINKSTLSNVESGRFGISVTVLYDLCCALRLEVSAVFPAVVIVYPVEKVKVYFELPNRKLEV